MPPPSKHFVAPDLPAAIQINAEGKKRKTTDGKDIDLSGCALSRLVQYECVVDEPDKQNSPTRCWPVQRLFRKCHDKKGSFMVETTAWEGEAGLVDADT